MGLFGTIGTLVSSELGNIFSAKDANEKNREIAKDQMNFQERMSGTSYQRAMDDMRKAGLNPMLAYSQGGASTPSGAGAHVEPTFKSADVRGSVQVASAVQAQQQEVKESQSRVSLNTATVDKTKAETQRTDAERLDAIQRRLRSEELTPLEKANLEKEGREIEARIEHVNQQRKYEVESTRAEAARADVQKLIAGGLSNSAEGWRKIKDLYDKYGPDLFEMLLGTSRNATNINIPTFYPDRRERAPSARAPGGR